MKEQWFDIELLGEVISGTAGSLIGGIKGLDYITGAQLLGLAAGELYAGLSKKDAWQVFHGDSVHFGDAFPLTPNNEIAYPLPQCLQAPKGYKLPEAGRLKPGELSNKLHPQETAANLRNLKETGYLCPSGDIVKIAGDYRMKTAINPETGQAAEAQLFGYQSIRARARYRFRLAAEDAINAELFEKIANVLLGKKRLGRSRSTEYGLVEIKKAEETESAKPFKPANDPKTVHVWLLSNMALEDEWGQPVTLPQAEQLGLPKGELDLTRSFLQHKCLAPFNGHLRAHEMERQVILRGSVLTFKLETELTEDQEAFKTVGLYRRLGYGRIWLNPEMLMHPKLQFDQSSDKKTTSDEQPQAEARQATEPPKPTESPLLGQWLLRQISRRSQEVTIREKAEHWSRELAQLYNSAWVFAGAPAGHLVGPSNSQWGRVLEVARTECRGGSPSMEKIRKRLFEGDDAICKEKDDDWSRQIILSATTITDSIEPSFRGWLASKLEGNDPLTAQTLVHFSRYAFDQVGKTTEVHA